VRTRACAAAAVITVACAAWGSQPSPSFDVKRSATAVEFEIERASEAETAVLREVADGTSPAGLRTVVVENSPSDVGAFTAEGTRWLSFVYGSPVDEASSIERYWRSGLIAVAYRREAEQRGLPFVRGWTVDDRLFQISGDPFARSANDPDLDSERLLERLKAERSEALRVVALEIVHPFRSAPLIVLETSDPRGFFCEDKGDLAEVIGPGPFGDGYLIRVVDSGGKVIWTAAAVTGAGSSSSWAMPGFQGEEYPACGG
jgi:hypothetical protein